MAALQSMMTSHDPATTYNPTSALLLEQYIPISYKDATSCSESEKLIDETKLGQWFRYHQAEK
jgi:hypothetical protein